MSGASNQAGRSIKLMSSLCSPRLASQSNQIKSHGLCEWPSAALGGPRRPLTATGDLRRLQTAPDSPKGRVRRVISTSRGCRAAINLGQEEARVFWPLSVGARRQHDNYN